MVDLKELNGLDIEALAEVIRGFRDEEGRADFVFRTYTRWLGGGRSETRITNFYGAFVEHDARHFLLEADEPRLLLGGDSAPNPVEHLLNALATCLTGSLAYHAAAHGIAIRSCECTLRGDLDIRGFLGVAPEVRRGFGRIQAHFRVESDAPPKVLETLARYSPVLDVVRNGTEVDLQFETVPIPTVQAEEEPAPV